MDKLLDKDFLISRTKSHMVELAKEINSWEDDVYVLRDVSKCSGRAQDDEKANDSLSDQHLLPVFARTARWERLCNQNSQAVNQSKVLPNRQPRPQFKNPVPSRERTQSGGVRPDVPRGNLSQPERERLERARELAELRRSRMLPKMSETAEKESTVTQEPNSLPLPPPPIDDCNDESYSCIHFPNSNVQLPVAMSQSPRISSCEPNIDNQETSDLTSSNQLTESKEVDVVIECNTSMSDTSLMSDEEKLRAIHSYYSRPKLGCKRRASLSESSVEDIDILIRQRSVTFQPPHGTAPGDTESEFCTGSESDADYMKHSIPASPSSDYSLTSTTLSDVNKHDDEPYRIPYSTTKITSDHSERHVLNTLSKDDSDLLVKSSLACTVLPISEVQRRLDRVAEIPKLIEFERNIILQSSAAVQQCAVHAANVDQAHESGFLSTPRRLRSAHKPSHLNIGPGSLSHVEASRTLLLACQRRQVLMEELALLHRGSPVLVPVTRGSPIRARLDMSAVRLSLKFPSESGGEGFVVVDRSAAESSYQFAYQSTQYHLLAIIKCRGEGRLFHSELVTLMPQSDPAVGSRRSAAFVDLPLKAQILPLRPDFVFDLEIYCMCVGAQPHNSICNNSLLQLNTTNVSVVNGNNTQTQQNSTIAGSHLSSMSGKKARLGQSCTNNGLTFSACLPSGHCHPTPQKVTVMNSSPSLDKQRMEAFALVSSVEIRYHDRLLAGQLRPSANNKSAQVGLKQRCLGLSLLRLPRSSPLSGSAGLIDATVSLEARVLTRGFLNVFEEVGGQGIWRRYWCQLWADHIQFWHYQEDEQEYRSKSSSQHKRPPLGSIDLRYLVSPGAISAPRLICIRDNAIYMRSLRKVEPEHLSASVDSSTLSNQDSESNESLIFRASTDCNWLEQKHLLCADNCVERDNWITWLNISLNCLHSWMPQHFSDLSHYDSRLSFTYPVSSYLAALLLQNPSYDGLHQTKASPA